MWATKISVYPSASGARDVILIRSDGPVFAVISLDDWWVMSATRYLANEALRDAGLNFKANELYAPERTDTPFWTTNLVPSGDSYEVHLLRAGVATEVLSLNEWAELSATTWAVDDAVEVAYGLSEYGSNIEEVKEALKHEEGFEEEEK
jgi:hypothetical protein